MIYTATIHTPIGQLRAYASASGLHQLLFEDQIVPGLPGLSSGVPTVDESNDVILMLGMQLKEYFLGERKKFTVPLQMIGTDFQIAVWKYLVHVEYGETRSYKQQALGMAHPDAVRAVAAANARNKILILVPCHRIVGAGGLLTGYSGGLWRKRHLLDLESRTKQISLF
jgi:O-6-methylguanine DNA methyltransferase